MILAVTLNPCLDKTLTVPPWTPGDNVRGLETRAVVGGKGNNVARALKRLGREVRPVTFLGGAVGSVCERLLREDDGFNPIIIPTVSETRVILTVHTQSSSDQTAFFDPDPAISPNEASLLFRVVQDHIKGAVIQALTLSGSSPSDSTHSLYSTLIALAKSEGVPVFLDTYGPALARIEPNWPTAIQLNLKEVGIFLNKPRPNEAECFALLDHWTSQGVECSTVTNGADCAFVSIRGEKFRVKPPVIKPINPIGSGDSMLAGQVDGWLSGLNAEGMIRRAFGSGIANALVWDAGAVDPAEAVRQGDRVGIEKI